MIRKKAKKLAGSKQAFIFGPFVGDLYWEAYRFAPYAISLVQRFPKHHIIAFTRPEHFDLYGQYADILVPLVIPKGMYVPQKFKLKAYPITEYRALVKYIRRVYENLFQVTEHFYPRVEGYLWKVKWQLPRKYMVYDFKPRKENTNIVEKFYGEFENIVLTTDPDVELDDYHVINMPDFIEDIYPSLDKESTFIGCLIELLKKCEFVISDLQDNLGKFSLLLDKPVISVNEKLSDDAIHLINPHNTTVIKCDEYEEGVREYENNFRS